MRIASVYDDDTSFSSLLLLLTIFYDKIHNVLPGQIMGFTVIVP